MQLHKLTNKAHWSQGLGLTLRRGEVVMGVERGNRHQLNSVRISLGPLRRKSQSVSPLPILLMMKVYDPQENLIP